MKIFVARRLRRIASDEDRRSALRPPAPGAPRVQVELRLLDDPDDHEGHASDDRGRGIELRPGDRVKFRLTNLGDKEVDATLLFLDSGYGITSFLPYKGSWNRIPASESRWTIPLKVDAKTVGPEGVVVIAVAAAPDQPPADFSFLEQPTLERARGAQQTRGAGSLGRGFDSPLGRLLQNCCFGYGTRSGAPPGELDDYQIQLLSWRTLAPRDPAPKKGQ
jgi:hypothetical protein